MSREKINYLCLIDDDPIHVFITKKQIELLGIVEQVIVFNNGKDAFDYMQSLIDKKEKLPEIIFLDLNMPLWDGWRFLDEFTKIIEQQTTNIYILSSSNNKADLEKAQKYSLINNYLVKPIKQSQLMTILTKHLK